MLFIILFIIVGAIAADQAVKMIIVNTLEVGQSVPLIDGVFNFTYVQNFGAAFSIMQNKQILLISATILTLIIVFFVLIKNIKLFSKWTSIGLSLIIGGGIGNLIDRIRQGFVVDYLDFNLINYPVFNFADICVVAGAIILILSVVLFDKKSSEKEK